MTIPIILIPLSDIKRTGALALKKQRKYFGKLQPDGTITSYSYRLGRPIVLKEKDLIVKERY